MAKFELNIGDNCFVCSEYMGSFKSDLTVVTGYSEKPIFKILEIFTDSKISESILETAGICQNCFIKFNEYDEHQTIADQIQGELIGLMDDKVVEFAEEHPESKVKVEDQDDATVDAIEYEPYEPEEVFEETGEDLIEAIEEDFHFEIIVDDTKENITNLTQIEAYPKEIIKSKVPQSTTVKRNKMDENNEFIVVELANNQRVYQCDICFKTCKDRSKLRTHREIHTDERNVICPDCGKAFKTMNCLRNHKRLHVPDRTYYNCDQCEKKYTQKIQLKKHIEIVHMQRRDFTCNTCGASFGTNSVLKMHILSHQDFRAEKCEICGYRFHTKAKLRRHMKSHTGERNYECSICFKKFLYSYNVIAHIRSVHEKTRRVIIDPFSCAYCDEKFYKPQKLNEHLINVHHISKDEMIEEEIFSYDDDEEKQEYGEDHTETP